MKFNFTRATYDFHEQDKIIEINTLEELTRLMKKVYKDPLIIQENPFYGDTPDEPEYEIEVFDDYIY